MNNLREKVYELYSKETVCFYMIIQNQGDDDAVLRN